MWGVTNPVVDHMACIALHIFVTPTFYRQIYDFKFTYINYQYLQTREEATCSKKIGIPFKKDNRPRTHVERVAIVLLAPSWRNRTASDLWQLHHR